MVQVNAAPSALSPRGAPAEASSFQKTGDSLFRHGRACPGHPRLLAAILNKSWMPGTSPGMTSFTNHKGGSLKLPPLKFLIGHSGAPEIPGLVLRTIPE
jgi:hypothetical protein